MALFNERLVVTVFRWIARILGLALIAPVFFNAGWAIQHGNLNPFATSLHDNLIMLAGWTMSLGLLVGWKWEGIGGLLTLGGFTASFAINRGGSPTVVDVAWLVTGLLYLVCWWRGRRSPASEMESGTAVKVLKRFRIPLVLVATHAVLVAVITLDIAMSPDPMAGMIWIIFDGIDYPISIFFSTFPSVFQTSRTLFAVPVLLLGTIQWGIVGLVVQGIVDFFRQPAKRPQR